jgi:hypothetical protein
MDASNSSARNPLENEGKQQQYKPADWQQQQYGQEEEQSGQQCPACQAATKPGADICEACGTWLLEGQCCFCYAPFRHGQKFCSHCGNPPTGITCKNCGTASIFDFCPKCDTALSKKAGPALQALQNNPEIQAIKELKKQLSQTPANKQAPAQDLQNQLNQLNQYLKQSTNTPNEQPGQSFQFNSTNKDFSEEMEKSLSSIDKISLENQALDHTALHAQIRQIQEKVFSDNQAARLYYTSIKVMLPELKPCTDFLGWKCNYASFIHYNGPAGCACPSMGGHWICKNDVQWTSADSYYYEGLHYTPGYES